MKRQATAWLSVLVLGGALFAACGPGMATGRTGGENAGTRLEENTTAQAVSRTESGVDFVAAAEGAEDSELAGSEGIDTSGQEEAAVTSNTVNDESAEADPVATLILFDGDTAQVNGVGASSEGGIVTITSGGKYEVSGTLDEGKLLVDATDQDLIRIVLNGASIHNSTGATISVAKANQVVIELAEGSQNFLSDGEAYLYEDPDEDEPNATLFSKADLMIEGAGSLSVEAKYNDGIASKDGLLISGGTIRVDAADDGIRGKDYIIVENGDITVHAGGDGLKSDEADDAGKGYISIQSGTFNITADNDGMQAETRLSIADGDFTIVTGGGSSTVLQDDDVSAKALKAGTALEISGGDFQIDAADDGLHSNDSTVIDGGDFTIATGDDGIHSESELTINDGKIDIAESYEGIESAIITINDGDIRIRSSDDGINVAGDDDGEGMGMGPPGARPGAWQPGSRDAANPPGDLGPRPQDDAPPAGAPQDNENAGVPAPPSGIEPSFTAEAEQYLHINGGSIYVDADGDGIDVNGSVVMTDGLVIVYGPTMNWNGAIDYGPYFEISGGVLTAVGSAGMAQATSATSSQPGVLVNFDSMLPAGTTVHMQDAEGNTLFTVIPPKDFQSVLFSSPSLEIGKEYAIYRGGSTTGELTDGLTLGGDYVPGELFDTFTIETSVTLVGTMIMRGGPRRR